MNEGGGDAFVIRRILLAVDASASGANLLEAAATLAAGLNAELSAIFVEDINLLRLAGLPFAREVVWSSAAELHLDYQRMERVMRICAAHARRAVVTISNQRKLQGSLQIVRGQVVEELLRVAAEADLLVMGREGTLTGRRLGSVARRMALEAPCSVLLLPEGDRRRGPVMVRFAGRERDGRLLAGAALFACAEHSGLLVVIPAAGEIAFQRLRAEAHGLLGNGPLLATYQRVKGGDPGLWQRLLREEKAGTVALAAAAEDLAELENQLAVLDCGILLVR